MNYLPNGKVGFRFCPWQWRFAYLDHQHAPSIHPPTIQLSQNQNHLKVDEKVEMRVWVIERKTKR